MAKLPFIPFSHWVRYLLDTGLLAEQLCGVTDDVLPDLLEEFWRRYQQVHPQHKIFQMNVDLKASIPVFSHMDEGRTYKKACLLILGVHGGVGTGTRNYNKRMKRDNATQLEMRDNPMGLNYEKTTWGTQFLVTSLVRSAYVGDPAVLEKPLEVFAEDMSNLAYSGAAWCTYEHTLYIYTHAMACYTCVFCVLVRKFFMIERGLVCVHASICYEWYTRIPPSTTASMKRI